MLKEDLRFPCDELRQNSCTESCRRSRDIQTCCQVCGRLKECIEDDNGYVCDTVVDVINEEGDDCYA